MSENNTSKLRVIISPKAHAKISTWVKECPIECSGVGKALRLADGAFLITEALLLKQEGTSVTTRLDPADIGKAMFETKDSEGELTWWWHSHVDMEAFWSGTDLTTINELSDKGYCLATVFNRAGDMLSAYEQSGHEYFPDVLIDCIPTEIGYVPTQEELDSWKKELKDKVKESVATPAYKGFDLPSGGNHYFTNTGYWDYRVYCQTDMEMKWLWELDVADHRYATREDCVAENGTDPTIAFDLSNNLGKSKTKKKKQIRGPKALKLTEASLKNCPIQYIQNANMPKHFVKTVYFDYCKYFKQIPTLEELNDYYALNREEFIGEIGAIH